MRKRKAFTLIELLVVIAIIGLLLSVLLPALRKVKEKGRAAVCLSHQRSVIVGSIVYSVDNEDFYPPSIFGISSGESVDMNKPWGYSFDIRSSIIFDGVRTPVGVGMLLGNGFDVAGKFFHCPSLNTKSAVDPFTGVAVNGHGMDLSLEEGATTWWGGVGASCWDDPEADAYRIVTSYSYRSASWSRVNRKQLRSSDVRSSLIFYMDVIDPRFGIKYAHKDGFNVTCADGSGRFLKVDFDDVTDWVRPAGRMDGLSSANDEVVYNLIENL